MLTLQGLQQQLGPCTGASEWVLGLSGGLDSMALLEALTQLRQQHSLPPLSAIHIHHGLSAKADAWAQFCMDECAARDVPLTVIRVQLPAGASVEDAARQARYEAFTRVLPPNAVLLLAHHADDQLETLLFRMLRGTGLRGLAGMPQQRQLAEGSLFRPLLPLSRVQVQQWARAQGLRWIEDPANQDARFARTALRHRLLPTLREGWPAADQSLLRLAAHVSEANELLDERAEQDLATVATPLADAWLTGWRSLEVEALCDLSPARQRNLLRYWLAAQGALLPSTRRLDAWLSQLPAAGDSQPQLDLDDCRLYRSSGRIWFVPGDWPQGGTPELLSSHSLQRLAAGNGCLHLSALPAVGGPWHIAYRLGGEQIRLPGRGTQSVKQLLQQAHIPAWLRPSVPLLYCGNELVSVAGRWNAEVALMDAVQGGFTVSWEPVSD